MPIYEYRCLDCGKISEYFITSNSEKNEIICKYCGSQRLEKIFSPVNISSGTLSNKGLTCCGREERCDTPPCATDGVCRRDK